MVHQHEAGEERAEDCADDVGEIKAGDGQADGFVGVGRVVAEDGEDGAEGKRSGGDDEVMGKGDGRCRNVLVGLGRAEDMGQDDQDRGEDRPVRAGREEDQCKSAAGRNHRTEPPQLSFEERRGFAAGELRR